MIAARDGVGDKQDPRENSVRKRSKTMAFRCTLEEYKLICEMAAWSGMSRQDYIIAKLTDSQVEVRPSVSVQKALRDSIAELTKEVHLATSYGELSESLQQKIELVTRFFLALGVPVDAPTEETSRQAAPLEEAAASAIDAGSDTASIFGIGRGQALNARPSTPCPQAIRRGRRCRPRPKTPSPGRPPSSQGRRHKGPGRPCIPFPASWWSNRHRGWRR